MNQDDISNLLTAEELLHMAIEASNRERYDLSIAYLKLAIGKPEPLKREIPFMLGAQYAQIGMKTEAKTYFAQSIDISPDFDIAIFQLALLQLLDGEQAAAESTFQRLDFLPPGHALNLFRRGMIALSLSNLAEAKVALRSGLEAGLDNAPLLAEMQRILANVEKMPEDAAPAEEVDHSPSDDHIFLSAYRG